MGSEKNHELIRKLSFHKIFVYLKKNVVRKKTFGFNIFLGPKKIFGSTNIRAKRRGGVVGGLVVEGVGVEGAQSHFMGVKWNFNFALHIKVMKKKKMKHMSYDSSTNNLNLILLVACVAKLKLGLDILKFVF